MTLPVSVIWGLAETLGVHLLPGSLWLWSPKPGNCPKPIYTGLGPAIACPILLQTVTLDILSRGRSNLHGPGLSSTSSVTSCHLLGEAFLEALHKNPNLSPAVFLKRQSLPVEHQAFQDRRGLVSSESDALGVEWSW